MALLEIGSEAPGFTLPNQHGKDVSLSVHAGKSVLVWFFPRAFGNN
jgi:peroxiredoxin Q/BCP